MTEQTVYEKGQEEQSLFERVRRLVFEEWDILLIQFFFAAMIYQAVTTLEGTSRQFPLVFLAFGFVAITFELVVRLLPPAYREPIERLTTGLAADMGEEAEEAVKEQPDETQPGSEAEAASRPPTYASEEMSKNEVIILTIALITGFGVLSYYISFMLAMPPFVFATFYLIGSRNYTHAAMTSVALLVFLQVVFADVMNVPIDTGVLFGWEDVMELLGI